MSGRSPSGVASLRARFEHNTESTSPPSRGRSPAGSATSDTSRPVSKVRTNFISVERSGKMGDHLNVNELGGKEAIAGDDMLASNGPSKGDTVEKPQTNGESPQQPTAVTDTKDVPDQSGPPLADTRPAAMDGSSDANPDKPVSTAEDNVPSMLPADPKDEAAVSGGAAIGEHSEELGSILKGSPFEKDRGKSEVTTKRTDDKAHATSSPSKKQTKHLTNGLTNGKSKEAQMPKPAAPSKPKDTPPTLRADKKPVAVSSSPKVSNDPKGNSKAALSPTNSATGAAARPPAFSNASRTPEKKDSKTATSVPRTPTNVNKSTKHSEPIKAEPKREEVKEPKATTKETKKPITGPPAKSKPPVTVTNKASSKPGSASTTSTAKTAKKVSPTPTKSTFTKPRPKSPTRPTKMPSAATASTAASAAKLDGAPPSLNDRKPMNHLSTKDHAPSASTKSQTKSARTSLPAASKLAEKAKTPKSRMSMASNKGAEGSFLERMMRPTQSSSQKTHDKVEPKTPPKKQHAKPQRMSEGSNKSKPEHVEAKSKTVEESTPISKEPSTEPIDASSTNGAMHSASAAAHTIPASIPSQ